MPTNRLAYTKNPDSQPVSGGVAYKANPSNYGNATTKVINLNNNNWLGDSVVFTVDSAWRYVVHVRNTHNGTSSIHIDDVRVYGMNTATYLACDAASGGYRYGYGSHEKIDEVYGSDNVVDMGDRWLDVRLGRTHKLDRHKGNYSAISPYAYALNSPLLFIDPDGKDARVTVQKDPNGGGKMIVSSTVYITGKNANSFNADLYTQKADQLYQTGTYINNSGEEFEVVFDVKFESAPDISKIQIQDGDNVLYYVEEISQSQVIGNITGEIDKDGNVFDIKSFTGIEGIIGSQDAIGSSHRATIHETLHFLGLSDRYDDDASGESQPDKGFEKDIMGSYYGTQMNQTHYDNIGKAYSGKEAGNYILKEHVDIRSSDGALIGGSSDGKRPIPEAKKE